jgi:hypothetical protein
MSSAGEDANSCCHSFPCLKGGSCLPPRSIATFDQLHSKQRLEPEAIAELLIEICTAPFLASK